MKKEYQLIWNWKNEKFNEIVAKWENSKNLWLKQFYNGKMEALNELADLLLKKVYENEN